MTFVATLLAASMSPSATAASASLRHSAASLRVDLPQEATIKAVAQTSVTINMFRIIILDFFIVSPAHVRVICAAAVEG